MDIKIVNEKYNGFFLQLFDIIIELRKMNRLKRKITRIHLLHK